MTISLFYPFKRSSPIFKQHQKSLPSNQSGQQFPFYTIIISLISSTISTLLTQLNQIFRLQIQMYAPTPVANPNLQMMGMPMNPMMSPMLGMGGLNTNPRYFYFVGNSISLQSRLNSMTDQDLSQIIDATIVVTGSQIQELNMCGMICTSVWGGFVIFPLFFMCCDWWKRCIYPAFDIAPAVYMSLQKLLKAPNIKNITLTVNDNLFDAEKANIIYQALCQSRINGITFINQAGNYNFHGSEFSDFVKNMKPIKQLPNVMSDIRWNNQIAL